MSEKRYCFFSAKGESICKIAEKTGRNKSTISRELARNKPPQKAEAIPGSSRPSAAACLASLSEG
ncbi:MAG: helix-turn-helix domain-containing protein [Clostridia bacterium]|nr:helix-turn-helix domain-containing protein [Clostridia bacterium]